MATQRNPGRELNQKNNLKELKPNEHTKNHETTTAKYKTKQTKKQRKTATEETFYRDEVNEEN